MGCRLQSLIVKGGCGLVVSAIEGVVALVSADFGSGGQVLQLAGHIHCFLETLLRVVASTELRQGIAVPAENLRQPDASVLQLPQRLEGVFLRTQSGPIAALITEQSA